MLRKDEIIEEAKRFLQNNLGYVLEIPSVDRTDYLVNTDLLIRRKLSELVVSSSPVVSTEYSVLVDRNVYERLAVAKTPTNMEPPEINDERVRRLEAARKSMIDIPMKGFEKFAIVHKIANAERDRLSFNSFQWQILSDKAVAFLWFDGENDFLSIPIIKW